MDSIGASLTHVAPDAVEMGFVHGGIIVEYKMNILAPATASLTARGEVVKAGRALTAARAEVYAQDGKHVATMQQTLMMLAGRPDHPE